MGKGEVSGPAKFNVEYSRLGQSDLWKKRRSGGNEQHPGTTSNTVLTNRQQGRGCATHLKVGQTESRYHSG